MEGYTPGALPSIDFLEGRYARIEALSVEKHAEDLLAVYGPDTPREMDLPLSGASGRYGGTGQPFKSDVGS